jgi:hypothetical protein
MSLFQNIEHVFASAAQDTVKAAKFVEQHVLPVLQKAKGNEALVEEITGLVSPQAANIERVAFAGLGVLIKAILDAEAAGNAGGVNVSLDAALVADLKAIAPTIKAAAGTAPNSVSK